MIKNYIFKFFILISVIIGTPIYAQADKVVFPIGDVSEASKKSCREAGKNSYWHDSENLCTNTFETAAGEIIHYVGSWSPEGAKGYGQLYVYDAKDGSFIALYKGEFKNSVFHGFGHFIEVYDNRQGENVTRMTIGNWKNDSADGFTYQTITDNKTKEVSVFYGEFKDGARHGNSIITTSEQGASNVIWGDSRVISHVQSNLLLDETSNAWVQHKYFGNTTTYSKKDNADHSASIK